MNLDFAKVCGKHSAIFEAYYKQIDPKGSGAIEAMTAAKFLKKSGLSDVVLSRIWDLSDPNGKGFLDKPGFFVALKLVSLAQSGQVINMSNIYMETANPPKVGDLPKIVPQRIQTVPAVSGCAPIGDWSISVIDRLKYEQLFESLQPLNNMLPGNKVKGVLMNSKLPTEILGKIWDLADQDKDGNLDKHEFIVAMHLVAQTLEKRAVPDILPTELRKSRPGVGPMLPKPAPPIVGGVGVGITDMPRAPSGEGFADSGAFVAHFPKDIAPPSIVPPPMVARLPPVGGNTDAPLIPIGGPPSAADWVVTPAEVKRFEILFCQSDLDKDGLVSGLEVKNIFLQSGVPQNCLAHIWALCDTNQSGKLTLEQFALAMWLVERKQKGIEPPEVLITNMVPPSMRSIVASVDVQSQPEPRPTYSNPELEMISEEIEELAKERRALELEIAQKESDIHIKKGEVRSLQGELDTLLATLKQLENQRGEAQKRLDDLKAQVNKIREQCQKQEETINEQESELYAKRAELQKLKDEETSLQNEYDENNRELQKLTNHLQNTQLQISSVRSMVTQLLEIQRQMTDALLMCRAAIENKDGELVSEYQLKIEPDFDDAKKTLEKKIEMEEILPDPFDGDGEEKKDAMKSTTNGFKTNDPFASGVSRANPTTMRSGFDDSFTATSGFDSGNFDAFGSGFGVTTQQKDPFSSDAFGANKANAITPEPGKDDFGSDPFAALHAPTGQGQVLSPNIQKSGPPARPESPSPALPPKKSKVPPPRPAPPRPQQGPPRPAQPDVFGSSPSTAGGSGGFADFADFDNKQSPSLSSSSAAVASANTARAFDMTKAAFAANPTTIKSIALTATPTTDAIGPTDFSDDPFKDYRYEDPFSIKDPFDDEEDIAAVVANYPAMLFKDDFDVVKKTTENGQTTAKLTTTITKALSNEFLNQFDTFSLNPSPVPSQKSWSSITKTSQEKLFENFADFDKFSAKSPSTTPISILNNNANAKTTGATTTTTTKTNTFFDVFNDNFSSSQISDSKTKTSIVSAFGNNDVNNEKTTNIAAAFAMTPTETTKTTIASAFVEDNNFINHTLQDKKFVPNNFEDDFDAFGNDCGSGSTDGGLSSTTTKLKPTKSFSNIDKYDAFGDCVDFPTEFSQTVKNTLNNNSAAFSSTKSAHSSLSATSSFNSLQKPLMKVQNETTLNKTPNRLAKVALPRSNEQKQQQIVKLPEKFAADFSKPESFNDDLEEAIKRSIIDQ